MTDLQLFDCPRHPGGLKLTAHACAAGWSRARKHREGVCQGCPIGARHAGESVAASRPRTPRERLCGRCLRPSQRLVYDRICVSCANREYELRKGKNAKGRPPVQARPLHPATLCYWRAAERRIVYRRYDRVAHLVEAEIGTLRAEPGVVYFARLAPPWPGSRRWQDELGAACE